MTLPREGIYATLTNEIAGLGGDSQFYKVYGKARYYHLLADDADIIGSLAAGAGYVVGFDKNLNIFDQFTLGNSDIRGFENKGIGPRMGGSQPDDPLGGTTYFTVSAEASFPMPGFPRDFGLRGAVFADAGTLFGNDVDVGSATVDGDNAALRASVGLGLIWQSPFGALRVDYAIPVVKKDYDKTQYFKFGINNQF
jgi:outer membrane protein insertion porin family